MLRKVHLQLLDLEVGLIRISQFTVIPLVDDKDSDTTTFQQVFRKKWYSIIRGNIDIIHCKGSENPSLQSDW